MSAAPARKTYDVVIVGGGMIGASIAWFLADHPGFDGSVLVVERDPTYEFASTSHTNSCIRQQFSAAINVQISRFGAEYIHNFRKHLHDDPRVPAIRLESFGYMYLANREDSANVLRAAQAVQVACGAQTRHMTRDQIAADYPFYHLDDIVAGNHNLVDEGYFDGGTMFDWWRRKSREAGVEYLSGTVVGMTLNDARTAVAAVTLSCGAIVACGTVVNAAGPRAALTAKMAGLALPVEPRKRYTFVFEAQKPLDRPLPLTIDPSGVHMRSDGVYYMAGCPPDDDGPVDYADFVADHSLWEDKVWPAIAHRIPQFDALRLHRSWVGHYAYNSLDQNAILGPHPQLRNFIFANGFSGHGLQQSPAVGRGLAEWIACGDYQTLDLRPFHYDRVAEGRSFAETAVI